eukprot:5118085-Lingulodinium_polyedra.AAC.1
MEFFVFATCFSKTSTLDLRAAFAINTTHILHAVKISWRIALRHPNIAVPRRVRKTGDGA